MKLSEVPVREKAVAFLVALAGVTAALGAAYYVTAIDGLNGVDDYEDYLSATGAAGVALLLIVGLARTAYSNPRVRYALNGDPDELL